MAHSTVFTLSRSQGQNLLCNKSEGGKKEEEGKKEKKRKPPVQASAVVLSGDWGEAGGGVEGLVKGAPAASNPHSCSPGLEPLQSPPVPPCFGDGPPEGGLGQRINNNNSQHAGPGSDAKHDPPRHSQENLDRSQDTEPRRSLGERRGDAGR